MYHAETQKRYAKRVKKHYGLSLHKINDEDCIQWLDKQESIQGAIKKLIREQIAKEQ